MTEVDSYSVPREEKPVIPRLLQIRDTQGEGYFPKYKK